MISNQSSMFRHILDKHGDKNSKDRIFALVSSYEEKIQKRTKIQDVQHADYNKALNDSIEFIEMADRILSFTNQLSLTVRTRKEVVYKEFKLEEIKVRKQVETLELIEQIGNKTEKSSMIKRLMEESMIEITNRLENLKLEYEISVTFVEDAERTRDLAYAYYQAIKQIGNK